MSSPSSELLHRPKRADARRNYDQLIAAAREAFTERDQSASLEDIARRAGVGIGTLYRHFPTRAALIEAVYVEEVEALARSAEDMAEDEPWDALIRWLHGSSATSQRSRRSRTSCSPSPSTIPRSSASAAQR